MRTVGLTLLDVFFKRRICLRNAVSNGSHVRTLKGRAEDKATNHFPVSFAPRKSESAFAPQKHPFAERKATIGCRINAEVIARLFLRLSRGIEQRLNPACGLRDRLVRTISHEPYSQRDNRSCDLAGELFSQRGGSIRVGAFDRTFEARKVVRTLRASWQLERRH